MSKYNSESVYGTLFTMLDKFSDKDQDYLMDNVFTGEFLNNVKDNPSKAYNTLNKLVQNIEANKTDKVSELLAKYVDKLYMMKAMLKDYGNFKEKNKMKNSKKETLKENMITGMGLSELANYLYLFGNDCRMLHLLSVGEEFLTIHALLEELYDIAFDFYDFACESAISHGETVINPSLIYNSFESNWIPVTGNAFTQADSVAYIRENGKMLMNCIESVQDYESWVQSGIDSFAEQLDKIINYKINQILK